jgi:hypothetical protein
MAIMSSGITLSVAVAKYKKRKNIGNIENDNLQYVLTDHVTNLQHIVVSLGSDFFNLEMKCHSFE